MVFPKRFWRRTETSECGGGDEWVRRSGIVG